MRKRFTDSDKWNKRWFRTLTPQEKVLWFYISETVTFDGFWEYDQEAVKFYTGYDGDIPKVVLEKLGMHQVDEHQFFLSKWIVFQYGELRYNVRPHKRIIERLQQKGLDDKFPDLIAEGNGVYG
jgi:hypothetical protein|tara:strand:- start:129 stop:500 length:372 start_codon:yes stop_codon:yes gene_type:complete